MNKKLYLTLTLLPLVGSLCACAASGIGKTYEDLNLGDTKILYEAESEKVYSTKLNYAYKLEQIVDRTPNTMEAWIRVPANSTGGMIAGNYMFAIGTTSDITVDWGVDVIGRFKVVWGCNGLNYTFPGVYLNDNIWHHVSLVRDPVLHSFTFYLDGEAKGSTISRQKDNIAPAPMMIGTDNRQWTVQNEMFDGDIREVTMYDNTLSASDIKEDYDRAIGYNSKHEEHVIGNWYLGEQWKNIVVNSTCGNNRAYLVSQDKYIDIPPVGDYDYTIMAMPDIQTLVDFPRSNWEAKNNYYNAMKWIGNRIESDKIAFALQVGDISDDGSDDIEYYRAKKGFDMWNGKLPYVTVPGNHDYTDNCTKSPVSTRDLTLYNEYFGVDTAKQFSQFGGTYEPNAIENSYYLFDVGEVKYCVIALELFPRLSVVKWAGRICEQFPDRRVIVMTHCYNDYYGRVSGENGSWNPDSYKYFANNNEVTYGTEVWDGLVKRYKNIFMTISGHFNADDPIITKNYGDNGNPIINILIDWQCTNHRGQVSWSLDPIDVIAPLKFNEAKKEIYFRAISPKYNKAFNIQGQMTISFNEWQEPLEADYGVVIYE